MKKTSLSDIAKSLGVSKTLVSMVMNGKGNEMGINIKTQEKVLAKAKELNYRPNHFARGLRMGSSQSIGLIVSDVSNPFYAKICKVVENEISQKGYNLLICSTDENVQREREIIEVMLSKQVDGIILSSSDYSGATIKYIQERSCPLVLIDRKVDGVIVDFVGVENHKGAYEMTQLLLNKKYQKIAFFNISPAEVSSVKDRFNGFKSAINESNGHEKLTNIYNIDFKNVQNEVNAALIECFKDGVDAVFTVNNNVAIAVMTELRKLNKSIGNDVGLVSFDDVELFSLSSPTISSVAQPIEDIATCAAKRIVEIIKQPDSAKTEKLLSTDLMVRESI